MAVDYNVVILGGSLEARWAAVWAAQQGARVALVTEGAADWSLVAVGYWSRVGLIAHQAQQASWLWENSPPGKWSWERAYRWVEHQVWRCQSHYGDAALLQVGVDVVAGPGQLTAEPQLVVQTPERTLRACNYIVALAGTPQLPAIPQLHQVPWQTIHDWLAWWQPPGRVAIWGDTPAGVVLAQAWARLGIPVTLFLSESRLLPWEEQALAQRFTRLLQAEGVELAPSPQHLTHQPPRIRLDTSQGPWEVDTLVLTTSPEVAPERLGLLQLRRRGPHLQVNARGQTSHQRIYAVGDAVGRYPVPGLLGYELASVLHRLLYPWRPPPNLPLSWVIPTDPVWLRQGWTEAQARQRYGRRLQVQTQPHSQRITTRQGRLLGWHALENAALYRHFSPLAASQLPWDSWRWLCGETRLLSAPPRTWWRRAWFTWQRDWTP